MTLLRSGYRYTLTPTSATSAEDLLATLGRHALTESVRRVTALFARLIGSLHTALLELREPGKVEEISLSVN